MKMNTYLQSSVKSEGYCAMQSSPFIRQGFGRISTASAKFTGQKGHTHCSNSTMKSDEGQNTETELDKRILNYINNHRPLNFAQKGATESCKNIDDIARDDQRNQMFTDTSSKSRCKVIPCLRNSMCYFRVYILITRGYHFKADKYSTLENIYIYIARMCIH